MRTTPSARVILLIALRTALPEQTGTPRKYKIHDLPIPTENLYTVDRPEDDYPAAALYEMEASGFFPVACRFSSSELVQCFKVISDNRTQATTAVTAKLCTQLITGKLADIEQLVSTLSGMAA
jgi:hypothetical protein